MVESSLAQAQALLDAGRQEEAVHMVRQVAASGDAQGLYTLAEMTWRGGLVEQDCARGRLLYEFAASKGHPVAGIIATNLIASGIAGRRDWPGALARLAREASQDTQRRRAFELVQAMRLDADGDPVSIAQPQALSERPFARLVPKLLTEPECEHLIAVAQPNFQPSMVYDDQAGLVQDPIRTSDGSAIHWAIEDPAIHAINRRVAAATETPYENGETLQSLRYSPGQEYRPHFDYVAGDNRRLWTALIYLNEDYDGGETEFVRTGLRVRGTTGDVLVFGNAGPDGESDLLAEHAGLPVTRGVKYLATRWIREGRYIP